MMPTMTGAARDPIATVTTTLLAKVNLSAICLDMNFPGFLSLRSVPVRCLIARKDEPDPIANPARPIRTPVSMWQESTRIERRAGAVRPRPYARGGALDVLRERNERGWPWTCGFSGRF